MVRTDRILRPSVIVALLLLLMLPAGRNYESGILQPPEIEGYPMTRAVTGSIVVQSNSDFLIAPWTGSGTKGSPYVLADLVINMTGNTGSNIVIMNTDAWFKIINCTLIGGISGYGILLSNVTYGVLENNTIYNQASSGIRLSMTTNTNVTGNTVENSYNGIELALLSYWNRVTLNEIKDCKNYGFIAEAQTGGNIIEQNSFFENRVNALDDAISIDNQYDSNHWSDYAGADIDVNGIGDSSYVIAGEKPQNQDMTPQILPATRPPISWDETPVDQLSNLGYPFVYALNITAYGSGITWTVNDTAHFSINNGIITNATFLPEGQRYGLHVEVADVYSNSIVADFEVAVIDTTPPEWIAIPENQVVEFGEPFVYDIDAKDSSPPIVYSIDDIGNFSIDPSTGLLVNATALPVGTYPLMIMANDSWSQMAISEIVVEIADTTPPTWTSSIEDQTIEFGNFFSYDIDAWDLASLDSWWISPSDKFSVSSTGTVQNSTVLTVGDYKVYVWVNDTHGQLSGIQFTVHVVDTIPPTWDIAPSDYTLERGERLDMQISAYDLSGVALYTVNNTAFAVTAEGLLVVSGNPTPGEYSLLLMAIDPYANILTAEIVITVVDTRAPEWTSELEDLTVELGQTFEYGFEAYDPSGLGFWSINATDYFTISEEGTLEIREATKVGQYVIEVTVSDIYGHSLSGILTITVQDTTPPQLDHDIYHQILLAGQYLHYDINATDLSGSISWFINNTELFEVSETGLVRSLEPLDEGTYWLKVTMTDAYDNSRSVEFKVTVLKGENLSADWLTLGAGISVIAVASGVILIVYKRQS